MGVHGTYRGTALYKSRICFEGSDSEEYKDRYHESLMKLVEAKLKGREEVVEVRIPEIKPTKNLMEALKASIKAHDKR